MRARLLVAAVTTALLMTAPHAQASTISSPTAQQAQTTKQLRKKLRKMERSRERWRSRAFDAEDLNRTLRHSNAQLSTALTAAGQQITSLQGQIATLQAGVSEAIKAVPLDQFLTLVIIPARDTWPCDSTYSSGGYWSIDFQSMSFC